MPTVQATFDYTYRRGEQGSHPPVTDDVGVFDNPNPGESNQARVMVNDSTNLFCYIDNEQCLRSASGEFQEWFGIHAERKLGQHYKHTFGEYAYGVLRGYVDRAQSGQRVHCRVALKCHNGTHRLAELVCVPGDDEVSDTAGVYISIHDFTHINDMQKRAEAVLRFDLAVSETLFKFTNTPVAKMDETLDSSLHVIASHLGVDEGLICELTRDHSQLRVPNAWRATGVDTLFSKESVIRAAAFPWFSEALRRGDSVVISSLTDCPEEAVDMRDYCATTHCKSIVSVPMQVGKVQLGSLVFVAHNREVVWTGEVMRQLRLVGDVFAMALQRKQGEHALRISETARRGSQKEYRDLAGKLILGQEMESRRLGRELHDDLTQRLAVLSLEVSKVEHTYESSVKEVLGGMESIREQAVRLSKDVHNLSRQVHPAILDDLGLIAAVESECKRCAQLQDISIDFNHRNVAHNLEKEVALCLYRVVQESLRNITKYAKASHAWVTLSGGEGYVDLVVGDNGVGFEAGSLKRKGGLGLVSIGERVRLLHGNVSIKSQPGQGTTVEVRIPLVGEKA